MTASATVLAVDGTWRTVAVRTGRDRATVAAHRRALVRFVETGDAYLLGRLEGRRVGFVELATDVALIEAAARTGTLPTDEGQGVS